MSDPMANIDAEDVLASIRRLVSQTHAPKPTILEQEQAASDAPYVLPKSATLQDVAERNAADSDVAAHDAASETEQAEAEHSEPSAADDRLILTSEFLVGEAPSEATAENTPAQPYVLEGPTIAVDESSAEDEFSEYGPSDEAVGADIPDETEAAAGEHAELSVVLEALAEEEPSVDEPVQAAEDTSRNDEWAPDLNDTPDETAALHVATMTLEQRIAELENAVGKQEQNHDWEPDGSEAFEDEMPSEMPRAFSDSGARVLRFRGADVVAEVDHNEGEGDVTDAVDDAGNDVAAEATTEFTVDPEYFDVEDADVISTEDVGVEAHEDAGSQDEVEHAADNMAAAMAPAQEADDVTEEDAAYTSEEAADDDDIDFAPAGYDDEDDDDTETLDEEMLREMVASVIREELQGVLGERITRNVRRLVRREVQAALALKDFD